MHLVRRRENLGVSREGFNLDFSSKVLFPYPIEAKLIYLIRHSLQIWRNIQMNFYDRRIDSFRLKLLISPPSLPELP